MSPADVRLRVAKIKALAHDDEVAHTEEDELFRDVLRAIKAGSPDAPKLAAEALKSTKLDFARWTA